jgi:uncharacterized membrane protein
MENRSLDVYVLHGGINVCLVYSLLCVSLGVYVLHHGTTIFALMCIRL